MYGLVKEVLSYFLLFATYYNLCIARYTGSGTAIRGWTDPNHIGQVEYPYHGAFANRPPYGYNVLRDPLWMNGRDLNSVSTCTKALGQPKRVDCRVLIDRLDWVVVQAVYEQGVQTEHLEEKHITLPRIYSYQTCVVGLRIMPNPKYDLDVDIASEWVIREAAVRINYVCLRKTTATRARPAANGNSDPRLLVGGWQIQGLYKRINITIFEKSKYETDSPGVEINSPRVIESCWYRRAMDISSETCSDTITDEESDDDEQDGNGPDSGGSGNGNAGGSGAGASGGSDPGASGPGGTSNNPTVGGSEPGGGL
ncbi:MAG: hypothetical protein M1835_005104 [Candelina submexicana]|nr:MAG: hypothetical protein M1835_005104 [Candelina submexicana]